MLCGLWHKQGNAASRSGSLFHCCDTRLRTR